jgi:hypothetical protein
MCAPPVCIFQVQLVPPQAWYSNRECSVFTSPARLTKKQNLCSQASCTTTSTTPYLAPHTSGDALYFENARRARSIACASLIYLRPGPSTATPRQAATCTNMRQPANLPHLYSRPSENCDLLLATHELIIRFKRLNLLSRFAPHLLYIVT